MRALVTGDAGFVGRHMVRALQDADYDVIGLDAKKGRDALTYFRKGYGYCDLVIHAAAIVGGRRVIDGYPMMQAINLELDAAMFAWALRTEPQRIVYLSSSSIYPVNLQTLQDGRALREDDVDLTCPGLPDALYGWTKLTGEKLTALARGEGLSVSVVRPFSGYGEDQDESYPFRAFAERAKRRADPFHIWGSAEQVRDWIHIDDICRAIMIMVKEGIDGPVNLGSGEPVSMLQLAGMMCSAAGYRPQVEVQPGQPMGVMYRVADVTKMREFFTPAVSLTEGISRAIKMGESA